MASSSRSDSWPSRSGRRSWPARHRGGRAALGVGLVLSGALHAAILTGSPPLRIGGAHVTAQPLRTVGLPDSPPRTPGVQLPAPPGPIPHPAPPAAPRTAEAAERTPPLIPHDLAPRLLNPEEIVAQLSDEYPIDLRDAGVGGEALLWLLVSDRGDPVEVRLSRSSGRRALDSLARRVTIRMRFRPAFARDRAVAVWIAQPIRFAAPDRDIPESPRSREEGVIGDGRGP